MNSRLTSVIRSMSEKFFGGKYSTRVERHLCRAQVEAIIQAAYEVGYADGQHALSLGHAPATVPEITKA